MAAVFRDDQYFPTQGLYPSSWRADRALAGGGCLIEHSIHDLDILRVCLGKPVEISARTANHAGHYPRVEVHLKDGYIDDVKGGGLYGELWREFLKYPRINEVTYPYHDRPG